MKLAISLGGSLLVPELPLNAEIFVKYANILIDLREKEHDLVVVCGGGKLARALQIVHDAYDPLTDQVANQVKADELGIKATWENAACLAWCMQPYSDFEHKPLAEIVKNFGKKILCVGGEGTGHSTDYVTVRLAKSVNADLIINATNVKGIYNKDPNKYKSAKLITELTYESYLERFGKKWKPGMHAPFDFEAARLMIADLPRIPTRVVNGQRLENILGAAEGKNIGTLLK